MKSSSSFSLMTAIKSLFLALLLVDKAVALPDNRDNAPIEGTNACSDDQQHLAQYGPGTRFGYACSTEVAAKLLPQINPLLQDETLLNTDLHYLIANNNYKSLPMFLEYFSGQKEALLTAVDIYGSTPLHLALKIGAPASTIALLITPQSVAIADKKDVTPLMLAARGMDAEVTQYIIDALGPDRLPAAFQAKDDQGRTVHQWNKLSRTHLREYFKTVSVDSTKSCNHPYNGLLTVTAFNIAFPPITGKDKATDQDIEYLKKLFPKQLSIELGWEHIGEDERLCIKATRKNAEELYQLVTSHPKTRRKALLQNLLKVDEKYFQQMAETLKPLKDTLHSQSTEDLFLERQKANHKLLKETRLQIASRAKEPPSAANSQAKERGLEL
jgi:ankyrin repeat protein